ncbi:MAG: RDD family protein, partial [Solirubrobacteraceae bacterium]
MSERGGLTPGDPLGGGSTPPAERQGGLWSGGQGYSSPAPPGAGGPAPSVGGGPPAGRPGLASWGSRVIAAVIDGIIVCALAAIVLALLAALGLTVDTNGGAAAFIVTVAFAAVAIAIGALLYAPILMSRTNGQTWGRMAVNIRVIRADGGPMTFWFAMLREVIVKS